MSNEFLVIDADAHVIETDETWEYLEGADRALRPSLVSSPKDAQHQYWIVDGHVAGPLLSTRSDQFVDELAAKSTRKVATPVEARTMRDIDLRLKHMSELGVDVQVLHNSLWIGQVTNRPDTQIALCRSWNRWLADIWRQGEGRLRWTCVVPTLTLDAVEEEIAFAKAHGAVGVCLQPFDRDLMMLDPYYYPIYQVASDLDLPIVVHIANGDPQLAGALRTRTGMLGGMDFHLPTIAVAFGIAVGDVAKTFPKLRWGIIEAGAGWIPWVLQFASRRQDEHYTVDDNPFINNRIFVTTQIGDDFQYITDWIGEDRLMIGTDYGHTDPSSEVDAIALFREVPIDETVKRKILSDNPMALYQINTLQPA
jgi:predicted TIM-barrel fold metal-dependent hydrolase